MILIFDLDDTLIDTSGIIVPRAAKQSCEILIHGGVQQDLETLLQERKLLAQQMSHSKIFPFLAQKYGFPDDVSEDDQQQTIQSAVTAFYSPQIISPLPLLDGARENLENYGKHFPLYLVTAGLHEAQNKKIEAAGVKKFFRRIFIISNISEKSKGPAFEEILRLEKCHPTDCLSIGNRLSSEIHDAKKVGMKTCYFRFGEHVGEQPQSPEEIPDFTIHNHKELARICPLPVVS